MMTPEQLKEHFAERLERYTTMFAQRKAAEELTCRCEKMVTGRCRRCQTLSGLTMQMNQLVEGNCPR